MNVLLNQTRSLSFNIRSPFLFIIFAWYYAQLFSGMSKRLQTFNSTYFMNKTESVIKPLEFDWFWSKGPHCSLDDPFVLMALTWFVCVLCVRPWHVLPRPFIDPSEKKHTFKYPQSSYEFVLKIGSGKFA